MPADEPTITFVPPSEDFSTVAAVRKRPGMYVGDVHGSGLHHMLWEVVGNALDEYLAGHVTRIDVSVSGGRATVIDDGRGIPVTFDGDGRSSIEAICTRLHATPTRDSHFPRVHLSLDGPGLGLAAVCALAETFEVDVLRDGAHYRQRFERGQTASPLETGRSESHGTIVSFALDPQVFPRPVFDVALIQARMQELAFLNPGVELRFQGRHVVGDDGLGSYCAHLAAPCALLAPPLRALGQELRVDVDVAVAWTSAAGTTVQSFVSQAATKDHGAHVQGLWRGVRQAFLRFDRDLEQLPTRAFRKALARGLVAVVHAGLYDPVFEAPRSRASRIPKRASPFHA